MRVMIAHQDVADGFFCQKIPLFPSFFTNIAPGVICGKRPGRTRENTMAYPGTQTGLIHVKPRFKSIMVLVPAAFFLFLQPISWYNNYIGPLVLKARHC